MQHCLHFVIFNVGIVNVNKQNYYNDNRPKWKKDWTSNQENGVFLFFFVSSSICKQCGLDTSLRLVLLNLFICKLRWLIRLFLRHLSDRVYDLKKSFKWIFIKQSINNWLKKSHNTLVINCFCRSPCPYYCRTLGAAVLSTEVSTGIEHLGEKCRFRLVQLIALLLYLLLEETNLGLGRDNTHKNVI